MGHTIKLAAPGAVRYTALISPRALLPDYNAYQQKLLRVGGRVA